MAAPTLEIVSAAGVAGATISHSTTQTSPSPPVTRKAARHPSHKASGGIASGATTAPMFDAMLPIPIMKDRFSGGK